MTYLNLFNQLEKIQKPFFSLTDLRNISGIKEASLKIKLHRLAKKELIIRLIKGYYTLPNRLDRLDEIANLLYTPSYLSFESALSYFHIISQIPYTLTLATTRRSKNMKLADKEVEYRQLKKDLYFGFIKQGNLFIAEPEKALLDQLYLVSRGLATLSLDELDLSMIDKQKLLKMSKIFPAPTQKLVDQIMNHR